MSVRFNKTSQQFRDDLHRVVSKSVSNVIGRLKDIGEECVAEAYESGNYQDITGNLRSSIGYVVSYNGRVVTDGGFRLAAAGTQGQATGRALAMSRASAYPRGAVLILVAGMAYAELVTDKGYNVLDSAQILMEKLCSEIR